MAYDAVYVTKIELDMNKLWLACWICWWSLSLSLFFARGVLVLLLLHLLQRGWLGIVVTCKLERVMQHFDRCKAADGFILKFDSSAAQQNAVEFWLESSCHKFCDAQ